MMVVGAHGGYRELKSYKGAEIIYDATVVFCDRFVDRKSRTHDQMVQAARSILTNGNEWRLYCRDTKPSHFFGINFELTVKSLKDFKYFFALFCPAAFIRDAQGKNRLDLVRESALAAQSELEADLRVRIFGLVNLLANGFAERTENAIGDTDEDRKRLYNKDVPQYRSN